MVRRSSAVLFSALAVTLVIAAAASGACITPSWEQLSSIAIPADYLVTADFTGDGKPDVVGNTATSVFILRNDGTGHVGAPTVIYAGSIHGSVVAGDFNGDDKSDLAFAGDTSIFVLPGQGDGTFGTPIESITTLAPSAVGAAKLDAGDTLDLVAFDATQAKLVAFTNAGGGAFTEASRLTIGSSAQALIVADIDHDGNADALLTYRNSIAYQAFYGQGDGTFAVPQVVWSLASTSSLRAEDIDGDGRPDLVAANRIGVAIVRNLGNRAFGDPLYFSPSDSTIYDAVAADFTGDGKSDVIGASNCDLRVWTGTGDGRLEWPWYFGPQTCGYWTGPAAAAAADLDGDGRTDAIISTAKSLVRYLYVYRNRCGDSAMTLKSDARVYSIGQRVVLSTRVDPPLTQNMMIFAEGNVDVKEGTTVIASGPVYSSLNVNNLSLGDHTFVASFPGDEQYSAVSSSPLTVHVTNDTTTTTLSIDSQNLDYGSPAAVTVGVTSSTGDVPGGSVTLFGDGVKVASLSPPAGSRPVSTTVGPHTYTASYAGDSTHPQSSASLTYNVSKQTPNVHLNISSTVVGPSVTPTVYVESRYPSQNPTGNVVVSEGSTQLASGSTSLNVELTAPSVGPHDLRVKYAGDANFNAVDTILRFVVLPSNSEPSIDARGTAAGVTVVWNASLNYLSRKLPNETWPQGTFYSNSPAVDTTAALETVYLYRMSNNQQTISNVDVGVRISFTDDPLLPGVAIKATHLQEIVRAANILRAAAGLPAVTVNALQPGAVIAAAPLNMLRAAINEARAALGAYSYTFAAPVAAGGIVRALDIRELREAVR